MPLLPLVLLALTRLADDPSVARNVPYVLHQGQVASNPLQVMDIFRPRGSAKGLVVFVYGGGWHAPRGRGVDEVARTFVEAGYVCALLSHRLGPADKFPAQIEDVSDAIHYLQHRRDMPSKLALVGHSSGANLCLLRVTDPRYIGNNPAVVVGLSTPLDLRPKPNHAGFGDALIAGRGADTFNRDSKILATASPAAYPSAILPPTLLVAGDQDMPGLAEDARSFGKVHKNVTVDIEPNCGHMGTMEGLVDRRSPIHQRVLDFIARAFNGR